MSVPFFFFNLAVLGLSWASQVALVVQNPPASAGDIRDAGLIPGLGRSPGEGNGNSLRYFFLGNPMDRGAWRATVRGSVQKKFRYDLVTK